MRRLLVTVAVLSLLLSGCTSADLGKGVGHYHLDRAVEHVEKV